MIVVHNDDLLTEVRGDHGRVRHVRPGENIGFGRGVNLALGMVTSRRVVVFNPDMSLDRAHFDALSAGRPDELVTLPLAGPDGRPMASIVPYPSPTLLVLGISRAIRVAPPGTRRRAWLAQVLGTWGEERRWRAGTAPGRYPLTDHWVPGTVFSLDTSVLRAVGGFDEGYFLYLEDTDLCRRLALAHRNLVAAVADTKPAIHEVGGSAHTAAVAQFARLSQWHSAARYAARQTGLTWRAAELALRLGGVVSQVAH